MKVVYITETVLPEKGMAVANRAMTLCRGLARAGCNVTILVPFADSGKAEERLVDGVRLVSFFSPSSRIANAIKWRVMLFLKAFCFLRRNRDANIVYSCSCSVMFTVFSWLIAKLNRKIYVRESSEFPLYIIAPSRFSWFGMRTFLEKRILPLLPDGWVLMTRKLEAFYCDKVRRSCRFFHLPMSVDFNRFRGGKPAKPYGFEYVAYMGSLNAPKDGVPGIIKAFSVFSRKHPGIRLVRIGRAREPIDELKAAVGDDAVAGRLVATGPVDGADVPRFLMNAKAILLVRPDIPQTRACFPTKLGEYLASGTPVVTSPIGEVVDYLKDRENCYFANYDDSAATAECLEMIFSNAENAAKIGANGRRVAFEAFHYENMMDKLARWLKTL